MKLTKILAAAAAGVALAATLVASPAQARHIEPSVYNHSSGKGWCAALQVPVASAPGQPYDWKVNTTYCQPYRWQGHEVDILTHGATYTQAYWDWQKPRGYSYVGRTLADGRATLNYDRIGNGGSGKTAADGQTVRPLSTEITMATDAYVLHQLVFWLKLVGFRTINSISHSYGVGVALAEATTNYNDNVKVSNLVFTGYLHRPSNPAVTAGNYPANQDPKFADAGLDGGYLTTRPGARAYGFHAPTSDPALVAIDEAGKDLVSLTGLLGFLGARNVPAAGNISNLITVPVLVVNGQLDAIFCLDPAVFDCANRAVVEANEVPFYGGAPAFKVEMVKGSGHDLTLHQSADSSYAVISKWIKDY